MIKKFKLNVIEIYSTKSGHTWRFRTAGGRLLCTASQTFRSRGDLVKNLNDIFGLDASIETVPFDPQPPKKEPLLHVSSVTVVELKGPTAPRRPRSHSQHARKPTPATLK